MNRRVVPFSLDGLAQRALRSAQLVLFEINPAETVEVRPVEGVFLQRFLDQGFGFVKAYPQVAQHVAVIIQDRSVFRVDRSEERRVGKECRSRWSPYH